MMSTNIEIQFEKESSKDYKETENLIREAFWNEYAPGCNEHYLMHIMRNHPDFIPELDIIAIHGGKIVGNIVYVKSIIKGDDGNDYEVLCIGPIAVLPEYQGKGIGGRLIDYSRVIAKDMGYGAIFLLGDPDYYSRQGFLPAEDLKIRTADNKYFPALQVSVLREGSLSGITGRFIEGSIYEVDDVAAEKFDKSFPKKEKIKGTPSQLKFEKMLNSGKDA